VAIMLAVAAPALSMHMAVSDAGNDPAGTTTRKAYELLAQGFGPGFNGPLTVVAELPHGADATALGGIETAPRGTPDVALSIAAALGVTVAVFQSRASPRPAASLPPRRQS
jgi:RND superfamily putative drug exporter